MTIETEFQRTRLDDNMDELQNILAANRITLEIAMAKLLEIKAQDSIAQEAEAKKVSPLTPSQ